MPTPPAWPPAALCSQATSTILDPYRRTRSSLMLTRHYGFTAEELDFLLNYDTCLRRGFGRQVKYRLGRDPESEGE